MAENEQPRGVSRRDLLIGGAAGVVVGAAGVVGLRQGGGSAPQAQASLPKWDKEADVVVLGTGIVCISAVVAHEAGAKVLMIEKAPIFGGHTAVSGGGLFTPLNFLQKQAGIQDSREDVLKYIRQTAFGQTTDDLLVAFVDHCNEAVEWLRDKIGMIWEPQGWSLTDSSVHVFQDYYNLPGSIKRGRSVSAQGGGKGLIATYKKAIDERKIEVMLETRGKRLVTNDGGEVVGVIAETQGKEIAIKAMRGVILGTGGFDHNKEMVAHYLRFPIYATCAPPTDTGDGQLMGMAIGADLRNMNDPWGVPAYNVDPEKMTGVQDWSLNRGKPGTIIVNKYGERIGNESSPYHVFNRAFATWDTARYEWRNIPSFTIFDSGYFSRYALPNASKVGEVPAWFTKADSIDALATALKIDAAGLKKTVERFNENARQGIDPDWRRGEHEFDKGTGGDEKRTDIKNPCLAPVETPPFYAAAIWPGALGTHGGLRINVNGQVLDVFGKAIPRLYACGNVSGAPLGAGYPHGGATIGPGTTFGYLAAKHAAALKPWA